jgi:TrmH family RNA methyltransferase
MLNKTHTKYIQSLHHKKFRDELGEFIAEGPKVVLELLDSREFVCIYIVAVENWVTANEKLLQKYPGPQIFSVKDFELEKVSLLTTANNVLAVFKRKKPLLLFLIIKLLYCWMVYRTLEILAPSCAQQTGLV